MREQQNFSEEFRPTKRIELRDRLKIIADSYYPIATNKDESPSKLIQAKIASPKSQPLIQQTQQLKTVKNENLFKWKSVAYEQQELKSIVNDPPVKSTPTPMIIEKSKTSVADLKQLFERKMAENDDNGKELAPELLPVRDKKRLFEKAIRQENEAKAKQYRKVGRLPCTWQQQQPPPPPPSEDEYHQSPKRLKEHQREEEEIGELEKNIETDDEEEEEQVSPMFEKSIEMVQAVCETFKSIDDISINEFDDYAEQQLLEDRQTEMNEEIDEESIMELTFTAIDQEQENENIEEFSGDSSDNNYNLIHRSSTRANISNSIADIQSHSPSSSDSLAPEKPQRLFLYEHEEKEDGTSELETGKNIDTEIEPPIRTISFYREQQRKLREEQQMSKRNTEISSKQTMAKNIDMEHEDERERFRLDCQSKMI
ncbi:hypothetical protein BLA29_006254, partial [Euroglyphus maynei]